MASSCQNALLEDRNNERWFRSKLISYSFLRTSQLVIDKYFKEAQPLFHMKVPQKKTSIYLSVVRIPLICVVFISKSQ